MRKGTIIRLDENAKKIVTRSMFSRRATFKISTALLSVYPEHFNYDESWVNKEKGYELLCRLFGNMVVLHAESELATRSIRYIAFSDLFEPVKDGEIIPEVQITFNTVEDFFSIEYLT